jgi:hypothetical protein
MVRLLRWSKLSPRDDHPVAQPVGDLSDEGGAQRLPVPEREAEEPDREGPLADPVPVVEGDEIIQCATDAASVPASFSVASTSV